jgi:hypothetical protein
MREHHCIMSTHGYELNAHGTCGSDVSQQQMKALPSGQVERVTRNDKVGTSFTFLRHSLSGVSDIYAVNLARSKKRDRDFRVGA